MATRLQLRGGRGRSLRRDDSTDRTPFVHRFATKLHRYVYDVNTRRILRVSPAVWDALEDHGRLQERRLVARLGELHGAREVRSALEEIARCQDRDGLFLPRRCDEVVPPDVSRIRQVLAGRREQLVLDLCETCNFRCAYCVYGGTYRHRRRHSSRSMDWETAKAAIDEFLDHSALSASRTISFYGGEPLIERSLMKRCVEHARTRAGRDRLTFSITTNGSLLKGQIADFLAKEQFAITVSLDGPAKLHDRYRRTAGGGPTWRQVTRNLREFLSAHPEYRSNGRLRFSAVASDDTDLRRVQVYFTRSNLFTDSMGFEITQRLGAGGRAAQRVKGALSDSLAALHRDFMACLLDGRWNKEFREKSRWVQRSLFERPFLKFHKRGFATRLPSRLEHLATCLPGARRTFVSTAGDYYACERVPLAGCQVIGNARTGMDFGKVESLLGRWRAAAGKACRNCWCLPTCNVGCFASVGTSGRMTPAIMAKACGNARRAAHELLVAYCQVLEASPAAMDFAKEITLE